MAKNNHGTFRDLIRKTRGEPGHCADLYGPWEQAEVPRGAAGTTGGRRTVLEARMAASGLVIVRHVAKKPQA